MKKYLFLCALVSLTIFSCKKQDHPSNEQKNVLNDNAFIIDTSGILASTDNSFTLKKDANFKQPKINEIVLAAPSSNCKYGMLRKVLTITSNANSISYTTEQSNLNDAFKELHINTTYKDTFSSSQTFARGTSLTLDFSNNLSIGNGVKLNGIVKFDYPTVDIKYEKENGSSMPKLILIKAELNSESQGVELTNSNSSPFSVPEKIIKTFDNLPPIEIIIPVGGLPLPILLKQKVDIACLPFELNGKFKFEVKSNFNATLGCKYENGNWQNISNLTIGATSPTSFTYPDFYNFSNGSPINAELTWLNPRYTITPMFVDIIKCNLEAPNKLSLELKKTQPNYTLKYKIDVKGGIKQTFWLGGLGSFSVSGTVIEKTLLEGNWGLQIGDTLAGGLIFYFSDSAHQHGRVCATQDVGNYPWDLTIFDPQNASSYNPPYVGGTSTSVDSGVSNTTRIIATLGSGNYAAYMCRSYRGNGYNDWSLPSKDELNLIYQNIKLKGLGSFSSNALSYYWSSSEIDNKSVWFRRFDDGLVFYMYKNNRAIVRATRGF